MQPATAPLKAAEQTGLTMRLLFLPGTMCRLVLISSESLAFVMPLSEATNVTEPEVDGLMQTALFKRNYINYAPDYLVLER
jgi:hypothetical protein